ncbi:hypothetical protein LINGRAHAP2_LOCUS17586 [Linum grandiflorum]
MFNMIRASFPRWGYVGRVSEATNGADWSALKVFGVKFSGAGFNTLTRDLTYPGVDYRKMSMKVNRQGVCYVNYEGVSEPFSWMKVNGSFCWSKYGVVNTGQASDTRNDGGVRRPLAIMAADQRY